MKLASLKSGRDGRLVVVSDDLAWCADAGHIAPTLQAALDDWAGARRAKNADRVLAHFADDEVQFVMAPPLQFSGANAWGKDALENRNETCVVIRDPQVAAYFMDYFARPELSAVPYRSGPDGL